MKTESLVKDAANYIHELLQFRMAHEDFPGLAVGIRYRGKVLLEQSYGVANLENETPLSSKHIFRIASHSKTFTATAIMQLVERRKLRLDDCMSDHLRWFRSKRDERVAELTVRELLSHSAGLVRDGEDPRFWQVSRKFPDAAELRKSVRQVKAVFDAHERFKYSNYGYACLGQLIEAVSGESYATYMHNHIIQPLRLKRTGADLDTPMEKHAAIGYGRQFFSNPRKPFKQLDTRAFAAATGFYSTVGDLLKYGEAHCLGNTKLLSDRSKREMHRLQSVPKGQREEYGLGLQLATIGRRRLIGHSGAFPGFFTRTYIDPEDRLIVTALTNSIDGPATLIAEGMVKIINRFCNQGGLESSGLTHSALQRYRGRFFGQWGCLDVLPIGDALVAISPEGWYPFDDLSTLKKQGRDRFVIAQSGGYGSPGEVVRFSFGARKRLEQLEVVRRVLLPWEQFKIRNGLN